MEFKSLLYQTIQTKSTTATSEEKPIGAEVGLGVRNASVASVFTQGSLLESPGESNFAIDGEGFFQVRGADGNIYYTRNGNFVFAIGEDGITLTTSDGLPVLDTDGNTIEFDDDIIPSQITVGTDGSMYYTDDNTNVQNLDMKIGLWQFNNPAGLQKDGDSLYSVTAASGEAINEEGSTNLKKSRLIQGYLEGSNVQISDEMVNLIIAQRAYEMNSKVITTSDEMLQQANQLKR
jgi:flagellar basal-body rod protein FlgG